MTEQPTLEEHAVIIRLDTTSLPAEVYDTADLATLEQELVDAIESNEVGEFDGNEIGPAETLLYLYGPSAEAIFSAIEPVLKASLLCQNAKVLIRLGGPDASARQVQLPLK